MADERQERLDELGERIDAVRRRAQEDDLLPDDSPEPTFVDPNPGGPDDVGPEIGDNQIAPP
jgi:hypothetical protein